MAWISCRKFILTRELFRVQICNVSTLWSAASVHCASSTQPFRFPHTVNQRRQGRVIPRPSAQVLV
ncbi:hypothetical protein KCP78_07860 [Salmonella enterica subsp. enterica]|nr:hypothetical protein KCP78_07860 [Salmonella enterica subsp. enterica]